VVAFVMGVWCSVRSGVGGSTGCDARFAFRGRGLRRISVTPGWHVKPPITIRWLESSISAVRTGQRRWVELGDGRGVRCSHLRDANVGPTRPTHKTMVWGFPTSRTGESRPVAGPNRPVDGDRRTIAIRRPSGPVVPGRIPRPNVDAEAVDGHSVSSIIELDPSRPVQGCDDRVQRLGIDGGVERRGEVYRIRRSTAATASRTTSLAVRSPRRGTSAVRLPFITPSSISHHKKLSLLISELRFSNSYPCSGSRNPSRGWRVWDRMRLSWSISSPTSSSAIAIRVMSSLSELAAVT
jgi:hypothetical protein